ncbi:MAG: 5'-methylthioadenosine/adenosylhomocysteine nucleosidase [Muribaculum sp.]|nr:5'-methylthioadenosine/adenosylhomocysteine nucleosidase [Muribaculum sp.]
MKIGIIVAMSSELNLLLPLLDDSQVRVVNGIAFHVGKIGRNEVVAMQCGIGKVNAAVGALTLIDGFSPDLVVNSGVAGGTGSDAKILDIVVGNRVAYHDVWCGPGNDSGQVQGMPRFYLPPSDLLEMQELHANQRVKFGLIASGDQFVDSAEAVERIKGMYPDVKAVDMESAAIAQVCHIKDVPFISIRVLSDTPGEVENNTSQYLNFWAEAPLQTFSVLRTLLSNI